MSNYYDRIDVLKNRALCVDVRAVQYIHDWGPVPPSDTSRAAMRTYQREYDEWLQATGGKPYRIALNSVDALDMAPTAATVRGLETLMHRYTTQGGGSFNGSNREPNIPGRVSDEVYQKMSYAERINYAASFPQPNR